MNRPEIKKGDWITIGQKSSFHGIDGYVIDIYSDNSLGVGYYQDQIKAIKTEVVWSGEYWVFKSSPMGSYLRGSEEHIVKNGPPRRL